MKKQRAPAATRPAGDIEGALAAMSPEELRVLLGDIEPASKRLASAPGLGWSDSEHPGHLLFPLFQALLGDKNAFRSSSTARLPSRGMDFEELELMILDPDGPRPAAAWTSRSSS